MCRFGLGQRLLGLAPVCPQASQCGGVDLGVGVKQAAHGIRPRQALPGVLAVNVEQVLANCAQLLGGGGAAVHPGAALALGVYRAAQQQRVGRFKARFVEQRLQPGGVVKFGAHLGAGRPLADGAGVSPRAGDELQGINQNGFAGAGFTGQHREAGLQLQLQRADDHEVFQDDSFQCHGKVLGPQATPSFQCIFWRRVSK